MTPSLAGTIPLLDAFTYRHRNQHSASHWWSSHAILRRRATALAALLHRRSDLTDSAQSRQGGGASSAQRGGGLGGGGKVNPKRLAALEKQIRNHAAHLQAHIIPRAHLAFSQLVADNQHAPLGLLLLAVLATVHTCVSEMLPTPESGTSTKPDTDGINANTNTNTNPKTQVDANPGNTEPPNGRREADRGIAISRTDMMPPLASKKMEHNNTKKLPREEERAVSSRDEPSQKKAKSELPPRKDKDKDKKDKKKKKKTKGNDELSSLFGSL